MVEPDDLDTDDIWIAALDSGEHVGRRFFHELNAATGGSRAIEDDVLHFLNVDAARADLLQHEGQHADPVVVSDD